MSKAGRHRIFQRAFGEDSRRWRITVPNIALEEEIAALLEETDPLVGTPEAYDMAKRNVLRRMAPSDRATEADVRLLDELDRRMNSSRASRAH